ncbi:superinfection immunity protein [Mesorhizobium erdmanii]|uniref:Superinfection immunity protein n=1 Tax=Mesorhizobium erdmanii TaxID=1777866 RepID=A0A6M7URA5_9HYPH|nr:MULTISPECIES: superinfection immunity protein [Mesorhizobium]OBQ67972.1 hypothetical protein A8146_11175 [Mesorhizobium loti]QKC79416.1 superinfection immunity protein [Mesorhizobium erdmanii]
MDTSEFIAGLIIILMIYLIPAIVAFWRSHPNRWVILLLNVFLGGTGIVWFGCLIWACMAVHISNDPNGSNGGESGINLAANDILPVRLVSSPPALPTLPPPLNSLPPSNDPLTRLERLKKLLDDEVIDRDQFERLRQQII